MRLTTTFLVLCVLLVPCAHANHIVVIGNVNATMNPGETRTFTVDVQSNTSGFSGALQITISGSEGLSFGATTTDHPGLTCASKSPVLTSCAGNATLNVGQRIRVTTAVTVKQTVTASSLGDAVSPLGLPKYWIVQVVGDGLSGVDPLTGTITVGASRPEIILIQAPGGLLESPGTSDADDSATFLNVGDAPGTINLQPTGDFFELRAGFESITIQPGQAQVPVWDTKAPGKPAGRYTGSIRVTGPLVNGPLTLPVVLVVADRPVSPPSIRPETNRSDVAVTPGGPNPSGSVSFTNTGTGTAQGLISSDVPALVPAQEVFIVSPGETKAANFTIDQSKLSELVALNAGSGSITANLTFRHLLPSVSKMGPFDSPGTATSSATVVITVKAVVSQAGVPPLPQVHGVLFIPGVGHARGSVGLFISDLSIFPQVEGGNAVMQGRSLIDMELFYTPLGGGVTQKAVIGSVVPPNVASYGDFVGTVYGADQQIGTLQIRTPGFLAGSGVVGVNANVFVASNPAGTFGTSIPVFRFSKFNCDNNRDLTKKLYITGLRKDTTGHTNFYVQETCGATAKITLDFHEPNGARIGSTTVDVPPFSAVQLGSATLPDGAVSAIVSHASGSAGGFVAYATPVDRAGNDTWAQVDWPNLRGYQGSAPVLMPVAGAAPGAGGTYFRTDLAIMNTGSGPSAGTLKFYDRTGPTYEKAISLNSLQTSVFTDVTTTQFGINTPHIGYMTFTPTSGTFVITSRNYSTPVGSPASFGTGVPTMALTESLQPGNIRRIGGIEDAAIATVNARRPATFRSNYGLIETKGEAARVRVTLYYTYPANAVAFNQSASTTIDLAPRQFILTSNISNGIIGAEARARLGDLHNTMVEFEVISTTGEVIPFVSTIDNGTGDSTFRVE